MITEDQRELFTAIVCYGDIEKVKELLANDNININIILEDDLYVPSARKGDTPLISACKNGLFEITQLLVEHGADVNLKNDDTYQPSLGAAAMRANLLCIELLLKNNADINMVGKYGHNALMATLEGRHIDDNSEFGHEHDMMYATAKYLIEKGININHNDIFQRTAFEYAAWNDPKDIDVMQYLIDKGANLNSINKHGRLVYEEVLFMATQLNYDIVINYINSLKQQHQLDLTINNDKSIIYQSPMV